MRCKAPKFVDIDLFLVNEIKYVITFSSALIGTVVYACKTREFSRETPFFSI